MNENLIIAVDVDDVVCDLIRVWLEMYNLAFKDVLVPEEITEWDITQFVKPEAKDVMYKFLDRPDLYLKAQPFPGALKFVAELRELGRVVFVTSTNVEQNGNKLRWLHRHGFLLRDKYERDYVEAADKSLILCDFLIDDKIENCRSAWSYGLLLTRPHNRKYLIPQDDNVIRCNNYDHVIEKIRLVSYEELPYADDELPD
jgi:5'(3')-deoxyribonucleotidase